RIRTSFMVAGMALIFKQINAFLQILQFIVAGLTFVPLSVAPCLVAAPFVRGGDMTRHIRIHGYTGADVTIGDYAWLIDNTVVYGMIGIAFYIACEKYAIKKGLLGHY